ncbi:unnamed protein product [Ambrosiozyma monospora]|uniref:Unnamed protein product n=1 Tax=Ambrosiozyma monospora TaxID=43982 RepID=A0ACB5U690_AMBMO|nr:unnamed protein product [Ambrosiozyma monospora]
MRLTSFISLFTALNRITSAIPIAEFDDATNDIIEKNVYSGKATYYSTGLGACGVTSNDAEMVVALSHDLYDTQKASNNVAEYCGKKITLSWGGKNATVTVVDRGTFDGATNLDLSPAAFQVFASPDQGVLQDIQWKFIE